MVLRGLIGGMSRSAAPWPLASVFTWRSMEKGRPLSDGAEEEGTGADLLPLLPFLEKRRSAFAPVVRSALLRARGSFTVRMRRGAG